MDKQTGPKGFLVVLPGEIIEIPQDSDKSWLTLFYSLPRELAEKWNPAYELPRCPYEVLWTDKYDHIVCDDMFKLLVWDCYAWCAWQFFQVKDRKGNYRDIPGNWNQYAGYFPLWRLSYSIIPYIRMKFEQNGLGFQNLYNIPQGVEVPLIGFKGKIENAKVVISTTDIALLDTKIVGSEESSEVNGTSVTAGYFVTDRNSVGEQNVIYYATFKLGDSTVYVENAGAKTESESVKNDLATIIQELINNGALDLSSFNG